MIRIIGIDPGLSRTAYAVLDANLVSGNTRWTLKQAVKLLDVGDISTKSSEQLLARAAAIIDAVKEGIAPWLPAQFHPDCPPQLYIERGIINPKQSPVAGGDINLLIGMILDRVQFSLMMPINCIHLVLPQTWRANVLGHAATQCKLAHLEELIWMGGIKPKNQDQRDAVAVGFYGLLDMLWRVQDAPKT